MANPTDPWREVVAKQLQFLLDEAATLHTDYKRALEQHQHAVRKQSAAGEALQMARKTRDDLKTRQQQCMYDVPLVCRWLREMAIAMDEVSRQELVVKEWVRRVAHAEVGMNSKKEAWMLKDAGSRDEIARLRAYLSRAERGPRPQQPLRDASGRPTPAGIARYFACLDFVFANYASLTEFPEPPAFPCANLECRARSSVRKLSACICNIRVVFADRNLKAERLRWHPDKFSSVLSEVREEWQGKAREMFVLLDALYREGSRTR